MQTRVEPRRVVVIEHEPGCPLDRFGGWLRGVEIEVVRPYAGDDVPGYVRDGLIVLGGQMSAYDDGVAPWLPAVRSLMARSAADGVPTLGICLGAQLLGVACGGRVDVGAAPGRESGVIDVRWRPEAASDPLVAGLADPFPAPSMHADAVVDLPPDSTWLGLSPMYPHQAFRVGSAAWGVQFHPEVSLPTFAAWALEHPEVDVEAVTTEFKRRDGEIAAASRVLAGRFADRVAGTATRVS
jgi:GMP synthase (glutamine-hydrolysing)